uniref:Transmembrane protein n=1 Tax=Pithovirus LCPAC404 TaxID=2506597 RepID=A0A481ZF02_9VIRU|nr:MAG: transmembrane protein [Pithovirus LCPAC404]
MEGEHVILVVIFAAILIGLVLLVTFSFFVTSPVTTMPPQQRGFNQPCSDINTCIDNLICETVCLKPPGDTCTASSDCALDGICSNGICIVGPSGGLNEFCPCDDPNLTCVISTANPEGICKINVSQPCVNNFDCSTNACVDGLCAFGRLLGQSCSNTDTCNVGLECSLGFCQNPGFTTGTEGAFCSDSLGPICDQGLICENNVCVVATQTLGTPCTDILICAPPLICSTTIGTGVCLFSDTPNTCPIGVCFDSSTCVSNMCRGQSNQPCYINNQCLSNSCDTTDMSIFILRNNGWSLLTVNPEGVAFERLETRTGFVWGLDLNSGIYSFVNTMWIHVLPSVDDTDPQFPDGSISIITDFTIDSISNVIYVLADIVSGDEVIDTAVFTVTLLVDGTGILIPFNTTDQDLPGVQFRDSGDEIHAKAIDASDSGDILLLDESNVVLIKLGTTYFEGVIDVTKPRFYKGIGVDRDNYTDIVEVSTDVGEVVEYQGVNKGLMYPTQTASVQREYSIIDYGTFSTNTVNSGDLWIISEIIRPETEEQFTLFKVSDSFQTQFPGYFDKRARVTVDSSGPYIQSFGICR